MIKEKWLVIDSHTHFLPKEAVAKTGVFGNFDYSALLKGEMSIPYSKLQDINGILRVMEEAGVDMAMLSQSAWSAQGLAVCKALNDGYGKLRRDFPKMFILCGHVPLEGSPAVVDEIDRCINELGLHGMALVSSVENVFLDSPELWPLYQKVNDLGVPIVVHPSVRFPIWGGGKKYELRRTLSREYDIAKSCIEVMYSVLKDFPDLKFLFAHYGGGLPALIARQRAWFEPEGWNIPDEIKNCPKTPKELKELGLDKAFDEIFDKLYFDMAGTGAGWVPAIKVGLLTIRADRTCFGSDYPCDTHNARDIKAFIDVVKKLDIPDRSKKLMLGGNIKRLFKL